MDMAMLTIERRNHPSLQLVVTIKQADDLCEVFGASGGSSGSTRIVSGDTHIWLRNDTIASMTYAPVARRSDP